MVIGRKHTWKHADPQKETETKRNSKFQETWGRLKKDRRAVIAMCSLAFIFFLAIFADLLADYNETCVVQNLSIMCQKPFVSMDHVLGTDAVGRDILGRIIHGTRIAVLLGFGSVGIAMSIATVLGCVAAFFGGVVDQIIMKIIDILATLPSMVLAIAICAGLGNGIWQLIVALSVGSIAMFTRLVRSKALSVANMEYLEAARALGNGTPRIILKYMVPNIVSIILINAAGNVAGNILMGATLSFIGLGVKSPTPEWGSMLTEGLGYFMVYPHLVIIPGIALWITALSINTFGDCLRDAMDPHLKGKS